MKKLRKRSKERKDFGKGKLLIIANILFNIYYKHILLIN